MRPTVIAVSLLSLTGPALAAPSCPALPPVLASAPSQVAQQRATRTPPQAVAQPSSSYQPTLHTEPVMPETPPERLSTAEIATTPALERIASQGAELYALPTQHGLRAVFARKGNEFRVFYLTPDGQAEIGGVMWNASGHNVTRDQVAGIPGVIPTVHLVSAPTAAGQRSDVAIAHPEAQLAAAHYGLVGHAGAPRVYMIMDPLCPFSIEAYKDLAPYVAAGKLQLALVPISINDHENGGASTPAALEMLSQPQDTMGKAWSRIMALGHAEPDVASSDTAAASLTLNLAAAHAIALRGTPTFVWKDGQGVVHDEAGAPDDLAAFVKSLTP